MRFRMPNDSACLGSHLCSVPNYTQVPTRALYYYLNTHFQVSSCTQVSTEACCLSPSTHSWILCAQRAQVMHLTSTTSTFFSSQTQNLPSSDNRHHYNLVKAQSIPVFLTNQGPTEIINGCPKKIVAYDDQILVQNFPLPPPLCSVSYSDRAYQQLMNESVG